MVKQTIKIFCRVKPTRNRIGIYSVEEDETQEKSTIELIVPKEQAEGFINNKRENYKFAFQKVFDQQTKQDEVFDHVAKDVVDNVLSGYNGTIFAYGQTGSGKTFTITGGAEKFSDRGIIPRALSYLYEKYEEDQDHIHSTEISYLEIYNESGYDLLDPRHEAAKLEDLPKLSLMEDSDQCIHLKNLSMLPAQNVEEALNLLFLGDTNRMIAETPMNQASTRSHCIFTIHVTSREPGSATIRRSKLHLVDLAGSERVTKTQIGGQLLTECKYINLSLHYLEQVIVALSEKNRQHIPYRNSMMTSVLRDSLGGNCMTTMIATVSVDRKNLDESISTCRFAQRVALIKNEATLNEELDPKLMILRLKKEIRSLKDNLTLVTGEQRSDDLTQEEKEELDHLIHCYLEDSDLEATLDVGGDMRKIQYSYSVLKKHALKQGPKLTENAENENEETLNSQRSMKSSTEDSSLSPMEIKRLKEILQQRDNEINILVNMLKKERKRAMDAESRVETRGGAVRSGVSTAPEHARSSGYNSAAYESESSVTDNEATQIAEKSRVKDPQMSVGRQEAFEVFKQNYADNETITDQKERLKQRYGEAKVLGMQVNDARNTMNHLKADLEQIRKQRVVQSTMDASQEDSFEENEREILIRQQMEEVKTRYKSSFTKLKAMKAEIDHLHHLLDKTRVKMQREFEVWWEQQSKRDAARPPSTRNRPPSAQRMLNGFSGRRPDMPLPPSSIKATEAWKTPPESPLRSPTKDAGNAPSRVFKPPSPLSPRASFGAVPSTRLESEVGKVDITPGSWKQLGDGVPQMPPRKSPTPVTGFHLPNSFSHRRPLNSDPLSSHSAPPSHAHIPTGGQPHVQRSFSSGPRSTTPSSNHIPLTGDSNTDANILAFIKARESLLQRNNQNA